MPTTKEETLDNADLDHLLSDIGAFGKYQIIKYILICFPIALSTTLLYNFIFSAGLMDYR